MIDIDLHVHSCFSDGAYHPRKLISHCENVKYLGVSDHDTIAGLPSAIDAFMDCPITFVPNVELSCADQLGRFPKSFHILGPGINYQNKFLIRELASVEERSKLRSWSIMENLKDHGYEMDRSILKKGKGIITVFEIFLSITYAPDFKFNPNSYDSLVRFTQLWIKQSSHHYVPFKRMTFEEAIKLIHTADGKAILAHPGHTFRSKPYLTELAISELIDAGLDGIEVFTPKHNEAETKTFYELARKNELLMSAGSDFHGRGAQKIGDINTYGLEYDPIQTIKKILYG